MDGFENSGLLTEADMEALFAGDSTEEPKGDDQPTSGQSNNTSEGEEADISELFPESVGGEDDVVVDESEPKETEKSEVSPTNFYSSIASALKDEGILHSLQDASKIDGPDSFLRAIEDHITARLDERSRRIEEALNSGVEPNVLQQYEQGLNYLNSITDEYLTAEGDEGERLRKNLIFQDYINRGFSQQRALREVERSFAGGNDIDDAKEALASNKQFYSSNYQKILEEAKANEEAERKRQEQVAKDLQDGIMKGKAFGGIEIGNDIRTKAYDAISRPFSRDEHGNQYTEIQEYQRTRPVEYMQNVALLYALTDGFQNISKLVGKEVSRAKSNAIKDLEKKIGGGGYTFGNPKFVGGGSDNNASFSDFDIDI